jgi:LacI family transcriptional regulator
MASTIRDVAKRANLSIGTVSRYLNRYTLRKENEQRIEQAIRELNFTENLIAKGLKSRRSHSVGVVPWNLSDQFVTSIVTAIERRLETTRYNLILSTYEKSREELDKKLQVLMDRFIDGLILFPMVRGSAILDEYKKKRIPIVLIDEELKEFEADRIVVDNFDSAFKAAETLIRLNHRKIYLVEGKKKSNVNREQRAGYAAAMKRHGLPVDPAYLIHGGFTTAKAYRAVKRTMTEGNRPTALLVSSHPMTVGALMALNELKIDVPEQLSVIGFGNYGLSQITRPALTVIEKPTEAMGKSAAELLIRRMDGDYSDFPRLIKLKTKLILKDTIRAI